MAASKKDFLPDVSPSESGESVLDVSVVLTSFWPPCSSPASSLDCELQEAGTVIQPHRWVQLLMRVDNSKENDQRLVQFLELRVY